MSKEYASLHLLRQLDEEPPKWEAARRAAIEFGKAADFYNLVRDYRSEVDTRNLERPKVIRRTVKDKGLEGIILGNVE